MHVLYNAAWWSPSGSRPGRGIPCKTREKEVKMEKIYITKHKGGKMDGMVSINFGIKPACHWRAAIPNSVCSKCYAIKTMSRYAFRAQERYTKNLLALMSGVDTRGIVPAGSVVRINAMGEVGSVEEQLAYFRMCRENPDVLFVQWTKEIEYIYGAMAQEQKPENLRLIFSGLMLNFEAPLMPGFSHTFTVWDNPETRSDVWICSGKKCRECMYCYEKGIGEYKHIKEKLR